MNIQQRIYAAYFDAFGSTPLKERINIIMGEALELRSYRDVRNLKEETGDLLTAVIQLASESGWDIDDLIKENLEKIDRRKQQYKAMSRKTRVAILGGAMNPITSGHIATMEFILKACSDFDEVWVMPCYTHMHNKKMESPTHRMKMCDLATAHNPRLKVFDYEIVNKLAGDTYTFVKRLLDQKWAKDKYEFSLVIGLDNANTIKTWVNWEILIDMIQFVVVQRAGVKRDTKVNWYMKAPHIYLEQEGDIPEVSSTIVREAIGEIPFVIGGYAKAEKLVGKPVLEYIIKNKLYVSEDIE